MSFGNSREVLFSKRNGRVKFANVKYSKPGGGSQLLRNSKSDTSLIFGEKPYRVFEVALAETIGTGMLMFFGCMGLVSGFAGKQLPSMQGGLIFGFVVSTIICIFGHISTAHLNPAVTAASVVLGNTTPFMAVVYLLSECIGACLGFGLLKFITPSDIFDFGVDPAVGLCSTVPHPSLTHSWQAFMGEFLATSFLIFLVCSVWDARNADKSDSVALKFALTIAAISIAEGPYTGASMNPARTLAPAIFNNVWTMHWVYWVAPISSGIITAFIYKHIFNRKRRTSMDEPIQSIDDINAEVPLTGVISSKHPSIEKIQDSPLTKRKANNS